VEKSTVAACKYLKQAYNELHNWTLVAAAYNYGINGIKYQIEKQKTNSYHLLKLTQETKDFVYRIIAYKTLLNYPTHFGIKRKLKPKYKPALKTIKIDTTITDIQLLSKFLNCPKLLLKAFNPWLLTNSLPNSEKKTYIFKYPVNTKADYSGYISDVLGYSFNTDALPEIKKDTLIQSDSANLHPEQSKQKTISQ
ncbi:MAG: transglycosylase SLT domain-containing protein, partial [Bacteroidia bacterium]|nr:transglycosylase SLT domain-containing protein [Bacteroidia bacterium]